ncbi:MAG TPA: tetratricopeptide repeat protein [Bacteroidales bacterium]
MAKKVDNTEEKIQVVEEALGKSEQFIEKNQKLITIVVGAFILILLGYFGFQKFYLAPREKEAQSQMFMAQKYFEQDSLKLALNGDGNYLGFLNIIDDYSMTKAANLSHYYAGMIYLKKGDYNTAIEQLKKFDSDDEFVGPMATGAIGDAYMEQNNTDKAIEYYLKAADQKKNDLTSPQFLLKAGWACETAGKYDKAIEAYVRIQKEFTKSMESRDIEKYIARAKTLSATAK